MCYSGDSLVLCKNIETGEISYLPVEKIVSQTYQVYSFDRCKYVNICFNIVSENKNSLYLIKKNSWKNGLPNKDLKISGNHHLLHKNKIQKVKNIDHTCFTHEKINYLYQISTDITELIDVNGVGVLSVSKEEWLDRVIRENIIWFNNGDISNVSNFHCNKITLFERLKKFFLINC